ncbi:hypothetical protein AMELA_G00086000 [Ameiurus melas]|uniref:Uncharacterized protein n=1 Tax=Ameiurus melas TaxID=219545 RepID=A0A7J6AUN2_AMEME|nr:hypothetical protein AMELA_G00086000 [Ameiurus melas]
MPLLSVFTGQRPYRTRRDVIHSTIARLQTQHTDAFFVTSGDFNHITLDSTLTNFYQFVDCPTRKNRTIDLMYANMRDAYSANILPPLGKSDHNLIYLQPLYKPKVQRLPVVTRTFRKGTTGVDEALRDCFESTDWSVLQNGEDLEEVTHCTTDYLNFCMDIVVPTRTVRCFPNNKPWITSDVKTLLSRKKMAFREGDKVELRRVQGELKAKLKEAKEEYRKKVEQKLQENNMKEVWDGMKTITGLRKSGSSVEGDQDRANQLNHFYNRFVCPVPAPMAVDCPQTSADLDTARACLPVQLTPPLSLSVHYVPPPLKADVFHPHKVTMNVTTPTLVTSHRSSDTRHPLQARPSPPPFLLPLLSSHKITADQVRRQLRKLCPRKAAGPDRLCPRVCASELGEPLKHIFNLIFCLVA